MSSRATYLSYFILSLFQRSPQLKTAQLYHILTGKRTASTLYQALEKNLLNYFSLSESLTRKEFEALIVAASRQGWLERVEESFYQLTTTGKQEVETYFKEHHFPAHLQSLRYGNLTKPVWERMQLVTQIFSEKSYGNRQYTPVIKNYAHQRWCKQWIKKFAPLEKDTTRQLVVEWKQLFERMEPRMANALAMRLTGHGQIGATHHQTAQRLNMETEEMELFILNALHAAYTLIEENTALFPLFASLYTQTDKETYEGLSESVWITGQYLKQDYPLEEIAQKRKLKLGTVHEHIIELAIVNPHFPIEQYVPQSVWHFLHQEMEKTTDIPYKKLSERMNDLPFYCYRLVQIERKRKNATESSV